MGFFSDLFRKQNNVKKSATVQSNKIFTPKELSAHLNDKNAKTRESVISDLRPIYEDIRKTSASIIREAEDLITVETDPEMFKPLSATLNNQKKRYVDGIKHNINHINNLELNKYEDFIDASNRFFECITTIHTLEKSCLHFVKYGYKKDVVELRNDLNTLSQLSDDFLEKLKAAKEVIDMNEEILGLLENNTKLNDKIGTQNESLKLAKESVKKLKSEKTKCVKDIEELEASSDKEMHLKLETEIGEIRKKKNAFESSVMQSLSQLGRPLRKYMRFIDGFEEKTFVEYVDTCISSPKDVLLKQPRINELLKKLEKTIESNTLKLDFKEKEKTLNTVKSCLKDNIDDIITQYSEIKLTENKRTDELNASEYSKKKMNLNTQLSDIKKRLTADEEQLRSIEIEQTGLQEALKAVQKKVLGNEKYTVKLES